MMNCEFVRCFFFAIEADLRFGQSSSVVAAGGSSRAVSCDDHRFNAAQRSAAIDQYRKSS